jgi:ABC-type Zn uptake system ZnuABC Zn-binding protein ZnuA
MKISLRFILPLILLSLLPLGCGRKHSTPQVSTSIFPLTGLVKRIYPSYRVYQIIKPGENPHIYDLTPRDAVEIEKSEKVFLIGNLEPFAKRIEPSKRVEVIRILNLPESANPHIWLSPRKWLAVAEKLPLDVKGLKFNPNGWKKTVEELKKLNAEYETLGKQHAKAVLILPAFYWLCKDYGIKILYILQPNPESGLSPRRFTEAVEILKKNPHALLIYSTANRGANSIIAALKREIPHLKVVGLNPLIWETNGDYVKLMEENLKRLKAASRK